MPRTVSQPSGQAHHPDLALLGGKVIDNLLEAGDPREVRQTRQALAAMQIQPGEGGALCEPAHATTSALSGESARVHETSPLPPPPLSLSLFYLCYITSPAEMSRFCNLFSAW